MRAVLVLLCGLPGAGKTSLARTLEREAASRQPPDCHVQRLSFDDLFRADSQAAAFEPTAWKRCQREMTAHVRQWRAAQASTAQTNASDRLVLLVDDNFQYRSLRKRFARLAVEAKCGFGILSVNTPVATCRARNAARAAPERVPEHVFTRMASAFEAPDGRHYPFERNARACEQLPGSDHVWALLQELVDAADAFYSEAQRRIEETARAQQQRARDQKRVDRDVVHQVDLQLRQWVSKALAQVACVQPRETTPDISKAAFAQVLNQRRRAFLAQLPSHIAVGSECGGEEEEEKDVRAVVAAAVKRFQHQQQSECLDDLNTEC